MHETVVISSALNYFRRSLCQDRKARLAPQGLLLALLLAGLQLFN